MKKPDKRAYALKGLMAVCAMAVGSAATAAPIDFPGGQIDSALLDQGEIYLGQPKAAVAPPGCEIAEKYVAVQNAGQYDKVAELFTPDGIFMHGRGAPMIGQAAINRFYTEQIKGLKVHIVPVSYAATPGVCLVQLAISRVESKDKRYFSASFDQFFLVPDGRAKMMMPYGRRNLISAGTINELNAKKEK